MVDPLTWTVLPAPTRCSLSAWCIPNLPRPNICTRRYRHVQIGSLKSRLLGLSRRLVIEFEEERCIALELIEWDSVITPSYDDLNDYFGHLLYLIDGGSLLYLFLEDGERLEDL